MRKVIVITGLIVIADQLSKYIVSKALSLNRSIPIIRDIFHITFVKNQGIAFGIFSRGNLFFVFFIAVLIAILIFFSKKFIINFHSRLGFSLILAGACGNFIDRIRYGYVIDFLDFRIWPVFNLSDLAICIGVVFLCIQYCLK